ncbi:GTP-binding protein Obg/CgtA [Reticulomyxa filosa]|uniref:GTP-binding protein Obg/CgtA n=1 Tax=Reticulomyxa filosa TaxID=46433 RepID=X6PC84_RETFI|nr:GTP-binding protein Obg/CgtA [Reticulomyxa filosa]|eukprot:ETO36130.1 GTP-binding protein Obg/CgtA [Reticulomyxa filosa]
MFQRALPGDHGREAQLYGKKGKDTVVEVPLGTVVSQLGVKNPRQPFETVEEMERGGVSGSGNNWKAQHTELKEFLHRNDSLVVSRGGKGGRGNRLLRSADNRHPWWAEPGEPGEHVLLQLELKSIADVGLVGFPNAGKSTLLAAVSNARPAISSLPFTTLHPHIGVVTCQPFLQMRWADIPGIVQGANRNEGLGLEFLRHIERTKVIVYVLDMIGCDGRNAVEDFEHLRHELKMYDASLLRRPSVIFANKMDLVESGEYFPQLFHTHGCKDIHELKGCIQRQLEQIQQMTSFPVITGSAARKQLHVLVPTVLQLFKSVVESESYAKQSTSRLNASKWSDGRVLQFPKEEEEQGQEQEGGQQQQMSLVDGASKNDAVNEITETSISTPYVDKGTSVTWGNVTWLDITTPETDSDREGQNFVSENNNDDDDDEEEEELAQLNSDDFFCFLKIKYRTKVLPEHKSSYIPSNPSSNFAENSFRGDTQEDQHFPQISDTPVSPKTNNATNFAKNLKLLKKLQ